MVWGRGNVDNIIVDMLRQIVAKLYVVETTQRRGVHIDNFSDYEAIVTPNPNPKVEEDEERI